MLLIDVRHCLCRAHELPGTEQDGVVDRGGGAGLRGGGGHGCRQSTSAARPMTGGNGAPRNAPGAGKAGIPLAP